MMNSDDIIGQGILLWRIVNYSLAFFQKKYGWKVVRLEDLNSNPVGEIRNLFKYCDLPFSSYNEETILDYSSDENSSDDLEAGFVNDRRNSRAMIDIWRKLPKEDLERIKNETKDVWTNWYENEDWI